MADLNQNITVNLQGAGNLPQALNSAKQAAAGLNEEQKKLAQQLAIISSLQRQKEKEQQDAIEAAKLKAKEGSQAALQTAKYASVAGVGLIRGTVGQYNPWAAERFDKAMRDFGATIGRDLVPWLDKATAIVRAAADAWMKVPAPIRNAVAGTIALGTAIGIGVLAFRGIRGAIANVAATASWAAGALRQQAAANTAVAAGGGVGGAGKLALAARLGIYGVAAYGLYEGYKAIRGSSDNSSYGMAKGQPTISGIEGYLESMQVDSLKAILDQDQKQTELLDKILDTLEGKGTEKNLLNKISPGLGDTNGGQAFERISNMIPGVPFIKDKLIK